MQKKRNTMDQEISNERLIAIILCMFWSRYGELICQVGEGEDPVYVYHLRHSLKTQFDNYFPVQHAEFRLLYQVGIIEIDSACEEPGHELWVYRLTEQAHEKTELLIQKRKLARAIQS